MLSKFDYAKPLVLKKLNVCQMKGHHILAGGTDLLIALPQSYRCQTSSTSSPSWLDVFEFVEGKGLLIGANVVCNALIESRLSKRNIRLCMTLLLY